MAQCLKFTKRQNRNLVIKSKLLQNKVPWLPRTYCSILGVYIDILKNMPYSWTLLYGASLEGTKIQLEIRQFDLSSWPKQWRFYLTCMHSHKVIIAKHCRKLKKWPPVTEGQAGLPSTNPSFTTHCKIETCNSTPNFTLVALRANIATDCINFSEVIKWSVENKMAEIITMSMHLTLSDEV